MAIRAVLSRGSRQGLSVGGVGSNLLLLMLICLLSVEFIETRVATSLNQAVRSGRSSSSRGGVPTQRENGTIQCCLPPYSAMKFTRTYQWIYTKNDRVLETGSGQEKALQATDGKAKLTKTNELQSTVITVPITNHNEECVDKCFLYETFFFQKGVSCYDFSAAGRLQYPTAGWCPIELTDAQVIGTDESGITTVRGKDFMNDTITAQLKFVDNGCIPIRVFSGPSVVVPGNNLFYISYSSELYQAKPYKKLYSRLMSLDPDEVEKCRN